MPPADFLLEAKAGHSPKSAKRELLGTQSNSRGERERGAALLREETNESNLKNGDFIAESQNLKRDSSLVSLAQNDKMDCHEVATSATSRNDKMESKNSHNLAMTKFGALDSANCTNIAVSNAILHDDFEDSALLDSANGGGGGFA
ncbi:hypothetical protein ACWIUD_09290 [Helicobacter sp. 23-1044]